MGLAASQATLLQITARIHDVEFEAQQIQYAKMRLALREDEVQQKYLDALDEQTLTIAGRDGSRIAATFDNICGLGSLNTKAANNGQYIFYDADQQLLVPHDVYQGYLEFGGGDPYEFAMFMMVGKEAFDAAKIDGTYENALNNIENNSNNTALQAAKEKVYDSIKDILKYTTSGQQTINAQEAAKLEQEQGITGIIPDVTKRCEVDFEVNKLIDNWFNELKSGGNLGQFFDDGIIPDELKDKIDTIKSTFEEYEYYLYKKNSGAESIYEKITKDDDFDKDKFNYYVRWGQLIEREGGIDCNDDGTPVGIWGCSDASSYGADVEHNPELLNEMIMYGKISIDIAYDSKSGVSSKPTSATTDSSLSFQNKSTVDSTAVKKAEAEYNKELKKINQIDKRYDMSLNRLETERNALTKEYESVKKVAEENIERTFGIFS